MPVNIFQEMQLKSVLIQGLFAAANIFSSLKLVYIFSVNPYLGPLQVSATLPIGFLIFYIDTAIQKGEYCGEPCHCLYQCRN